MRNQGAFSVLCRDDKSLFVRKPTTPAGAASPHYPAVAQSWAEFKFAADDCAACFLYACFFANLFDE